MAKQSVKDIQHDLKTSAHKIWLAGLGALAAAEEEGGKLFKSLVDRGEDLESRGREEVKSTVEDVKSGVKKTVSKVEDAWEDLGEGLDERVTSALHRLGVPSREEIKTLTQRIEELASKVEKLVPAKTKAGATTRRTPAKSVKAKARTAKAKVN